MSDPERADIYAIASAAMGIAILGKNFEEIKPILTEAVTSSNLIPTTQTALTSAIDQISLEKVKSLTDYLIFSQTQFSLSEENVLNRDPHEAIPLGTQSLYIDDKKFDFTGPEGSELSINLAPEDLYQITPLLIAVNRGREDMIEQARENAYQTFNVKRGELKNKYPPSWWTNAEHGERLRSDEVLLFFPYGQPDTSSFPPAFQELTRRPQFKPGWIKLTIDISNKMITKVSNLTS